MSPSTPPPEADAPSPVRYAIDRQDRIVEVGGAWQAFADRNEGHALEASRVIGRRLWESFADATTIQLYQMMAAQLRGGRPSMKVCFRCDAPDRRRLLSMEMRGRADGGIEFIVAPVAEQVRPRLALLDAHVPRDERLLTACGWCKRIRAPDDRWVEAEEAIRAWDLFAGSPVPGLSHGICPSCHETITSGLEEPAGVAVDVGHW